MKKVFISALLLFLLYSCINSSSKKVLSPRNLRTQKFIINPLRDTILFGLRGGIFQIPAGSFEGAEPIEINIKEVFSPIEILYAGLTTESGGRLLESGGMVYFTAFKNHQIIQLIKPLKVSIPSNYVNRSMQIFKGEENRDGTIDWKDPQPLDSTLNKFPEDSGKVLFESLCGNCHQLFKDGTGPAMAFLEDRVNDRAVLKSFIKNPSKVMEDNLYFQCQRMRFASQMPGYPSLSDKNIDQILDYIKNESGRRPDLKPVSFKTPQADALKMDTTRYSECAAPCGFDTLYVDTTEYNLARANMMDLHEEATKEDSMDYLYHKPDSLEKVMRTNGFADLLATKGRYNFVIKTMGWFNVDAFYEGMQGTTIVDLFVKTDFQEKDNLEVHVFFPEKKILTVGTLHSNDNLFHFEKYKGQIPLFLNDEAVAFAITSIKEKIYYGITYFKVKKNQTIVIKIKETDKAAIQQAFDQMNLDGIDLDVITKKRIVVPRNCFTDSTAK
jgi:mono/diheme cytochrome c family protein